MVKERKIIIEDIFTKKDKEFNKTMVHNARKLNDTIDNFTGEETYMDKYGFINDIIEKFSKKMGNMRINTFLKIS